MTVCADITAHAVCADITAHDCVCRHYRAARGRGVGLRHKRRAPAVVLAPPSPPALTLIRVRSYCAAVRPGDDNIMATV